MYSISKLRTYLIGEPFEIITDHKGLTFLNKTVYLNSRLIRWSIVLQQYDFKVSYCRGKDNLVAGFFSRNPLGRFEISQSSDLSIDVLELENVSAGGKYFCNEIEYGRVIRDDLKNLSTLQNSDETILKIINKLRADEIVDFYVMKENVLFRNDAIINLWQVAIPEKLVHRLIDCVHSKLGHPGVYITTMYMRDYYYWKYMKRDIKRFVLECDLCHQIKLNNVKMEGAHNMVHSDEPGDLVYVDSYWPLPRSTGGPEYIFVMLDVFSKYVKLYPIKKENTNTILKKLFDHYIPEMGQPKRILSDHGTQFTSPKVGTTEQKGRDKTHFFLD